MAANILGKELCLDPILSLRMGSYFTFAHEAAVNVIAKVDKDAEIIDK
jgi:hypothetical protein